MMFLSKLKVTAVVLLTAAAATGAGFLTSRCAAEPPKADPAPANRTQDSQAVPAGVDRPVELPLVNVPAQRDGVLLVVGTDLKEGAKLPADQIITIKEGGQTKSYRRLSEGLVVEEGQLLARIDDRLARLDLEVAKSKLDAAKAELVSAGKTKEEADRHYQALTRLHAAAAVSEEDLSAAKLNAERYAGEVEVKQAEMRQAETGLKAAETVLEMYEIRSPVRGVVKAVLKSRGEAVKSLETVVRIQEKSKE